MAINYALYKNYLTPDPKKYAAHVEITASADMPAIAERMIEQGSTTTTADILAVLEDAIKACEALLLEGYNVNLGGLVRLHLGIKGIFEDPQDKYDPSRHQVDVGATPGARVRKYIRDNAKVNKNKAILPTPDLIQFKDAITTSADDIITRGGIGTLIGQHLKYDNAQADEGIYFISTATAVEVKVTVMQRNDPAELVFMNPDALIVTEMYHIEVRARINGGTELRSGRLDAILIVA